VKPSHRFWIRLGVGIALLTLILRRLDWSALSRIEPERLAFGIVAGASLLLAGQTVAALRWKVLLGPGSPPWSYLARLYVIGGFFSLFLPTVVGGDAVRAVAAAQHSDRPGGSVASVLLDRLFGVTAMLLYALLGALIAPEMTRAMLGQTAWHLPGGLPVLAAAGLAVLGLGLLILRRSRRVQSLLREGLEAVREVASSPTRALRALALGFVVQGLYISIWVVLAQAMRFQLPLATFLVAVPLVTLGTMLPISLAGLGLREGAWLLLLRDAGIPDASIVAYSLLFFAANLLLGAGGGLLFVSRGTGYSATS